MSKLGRAVLLGALLALAAPLLVVAGPTTTAGASSLLLPVTGTVTASNGLAPSGSMTAYRRDAAGGYASFDSWEFSNYDYIGWLPAGTYKFQLQSSVDGYTSRWYTSSGALATTQAAATAVTITGLTNLAAVKYTSRATVTGRVVGADRQIVKLMQGGTQKASTQPFDDGTYRFADVPAGTYTTRVDPTSGERRAGASGSFTVGATGTVTVPSYTLPWKTSIKGKVTNASGTPLRFVRVTVSAGGSYFSDVTKADGSYVLAGLPNPGSYPVNHSVTFSDGPEEYDSKTVVVAQSAADQQMVRNVSLSKTPVVAPTGVDLRGVVRDSAGAPVPAMRVELVTANGDYVDSDYTGRDGRYAFTETPSGRYAFAASQYDQGHAVPFLPEDFSGYSRTLASASTIGVTKDSGATYNFTARRLGVVTGTVKPDRGFFLQPANVATSTSAGRWGEDALTRVDGSYRLLVQPGNHYVVAEIWQTAPSYQTVWWGGSNTLPGARLLSVAANSTRTGLNMTVPSRIVNLTAPRLTRTPVVGRRSHVSVGRWSLPESGFRITWLRGGTTVVSNSSSYVPVAADFRRGLRVRVDATHADRWSWRGAAYSASRIVKRLARLALKGSSPSARTVKVGVTVKGVANPGGTVKLKLGRKVLAKAKVVKGKAVLRSGGQARGKHRYKVVYSGSAKAAPTSKRIAVTVR